MLQLSVTSDNFAVCVNSIVKPYVNHKLDYAIRSKHAVSQRGVSGRGHMESMDEIYSQLRFTDGMLVCVDNRLLMGIDR